MKMQAIFTWLLYFVFTNTLAILFSTCQLSSETPLQFFYKRSDIIEVKKFIQKGDTTFLPASKKLRTEAEAAILEGPWTVVDKKMLPPSGNKHDYMSYAKYWWPDPLNPDGPYVRKDGVTNPHTRTMDKEYLQEMVDAVETLGLAYYLFDEERYAKKAIENIRVWFLNENTYMSPHMQYGQAIPNKVEGRSYGIIETRKLIRILDTVQLLNESTLWTVSDQEGIEKWFQSYLNWLLNSDHGQKEGTNGNNHETAYTLQVASYALFLGKMDIAHQKLIGQFKESIIRMIEPDGRQPRELSRTKSLHYSSMNLGMMIHLCQLADYLNADLWHFQTADGRSIQKAFDFLYPAWIDRNTWHYKQIEISDPDYDDMFHILRMMRIKSGREAYETLLKKIYGDRYTNHRGQLYWPIFP
jgi:hypothetical protein